MYIYKYIYPPSVDMGVPLKQSATLQHSQAHTSTPINPIPVRHLYTLASLAHKVPLSLTHFFCSPTHTCTHNKPHQIYPRTPSDHVGVPSTQRVSLSHTRIDTTYTHLKIHHFYHLTPWSDGGVPLTHKTSLSHTRIGARSRNV